MNQKLRCFPTWRTWCTGMHLQILPFRLNESFLFLLFTGCAIEVTHVRSSTYISHFSTLFENFISCSWGIWFCVFLELGKPYVWQYIPINYKLNIKTGSVLYVLRQRSILFVVHYWFWCQVSGSNPMAFQIISVPFSFVYLTAVTRYKEQLILVCRFLGPVLPQ